MVAISAKKNKDTKDPIILLGGTSLKVYFYLLEASKDGPVGVRELQRALGFRSPSSAKHHLDRLVDLGLAEKIVGGEYRALSPRGGLFSLFFAFLGRTLPITIPAIVFSIVVAIIDVVINGLRDPVLFLALFVLLLSTLYQTILIINWINIVKRRR